MSLVLWAYLYRHCVDATRWKKQAVLPKQCLLNTMSMIPKRIKGAVRFVASKMEAAADRK